MGSASGNFLRDPPVLIKGGNLLEFHGHHDPRYPIETQYTKQPTRSAFTSLKEYKSRPHPNPHQTLVEPKIGFLRAQDLSRSLLPF